MKNRRLKVEQLIRPMKWTNRKAVYPFIRLKGNWMRDAGILPGMIVNVEVSNNQIIINI